MGIRTLCRSRRILSQTLSGYSLGGESSILYPEENEIVGRVVYPISRDSVRIATNAGGYLDVDAVLVPTELRLPGSVVWVRLDASQSVTRVRSPEQHPLSAAISEHDIGTALALLQHLDTGDTYALDATLRLASWEGLCEVMSALLDLGADPNGRSPRDSLGRSPVSLVIENAEPPALQLLLSRGACPDTPNSHGYSPLHEAIDREMMDYTELYRGSRPLSVAFTECLVRHGARAHLRAPVGTTPAEEARSRGHIRAAELLAQQPA